MHRLLIAESSYQRIADQMPEEVEVVLATREGSFRLADKVVNGDQVQPTMVRLDWDLMMSGAMKETLKLIEASAGLAFVQTSAAGLDRPFFRMVEERTDVFCNSDAQAPPIAEYVVASVLNRWQRFDLRADRQRQHRWEGNAFKEVLGSRWLLVGYGNIGQRIARQVHGFGAGVTALRREAREDDIADTVDTLDALHEHLPVADVVVLACALNEQTQGMASTSFFEQMKEDAILVNIARGDLVDETALLAALDVPHFDYAVLDVFQTEPLPEQSPLWDHERVLITPHASNRGLGTGRRGDELFIDNLQRFLDGRTVRNRVGGPR